jgi:hypothetical protein
MRTTGWTHGICSKDWFEPELAQRTALLITQFLCMGECSSNKAVSEALEDFKNRSRQYEGANGKTLDEELKRSKLMGMLPPDLRSKVKSQKKDHDDCDDVMLIILEELHDFNTGTIPTTKTKPPLSNIQQKWNQEEEWRGNEQGDEPASDGMVTLDSIKGRGNGKGIGVRFEGDCHYCGAPGHRASECNKKTADLKYGKEAPGYKGNPKGGKGKGAYKGYTKGGGKQSGWGKGWAPPQSWGPPASWHTPHKSKAWGKSQGDQNVQGLECYNGPDWGGMWPFPLASVEGKGFGGMVQDPAGQWISCNPNPPQRTPEDHLQQPLWSLVSRTKKAW